MAACPFCEPNEAEVIARDGDCYAMWTGSKPLGSAMVLPHAHRETPFDLSPDEWNATRRLLGTVRAEVERRYEPSGWNIGWNVYPVGGQSVPHAHCHLIPRYADEAFAGRGLRWWLKSEANTRG
jgi:histidine triad (HIT) family protein